MKRFAQIIELLPERADEYLELHRNIWEEVKENMYNVNIRNYTLFYRGNLLFQYFEYVGEDFEADMAISADSEVTRKWESLCRPCHKPLDDRREGEWWSDFTEVIHID